MLPFTPRLRNAFAYAERRQPLGVSSLDLLAGVMSLGGGAAVNVLKSKGLEESVPIAPAPNEKLTTDTPVQYKRCALKALSGALTEALGMSHQLVGVEHMLAGILVSPSPEISNLFAEKGINLGEALSELRKNI